MNGALFLVAASLCAWGDPAPAPAVVAPPVAGCTGCATPCDTCKPGFFDRLKAKFAHHEDCGCEPGVLDRLKGAFAKPDCGCMPHSPVYHPLPSFHTGCGCDDGCRVGFLEHLKGRFSRGECGCAPASPCAPCGGIGMPPGAILSNPYAPTPYTTPYAPPYMTPAPGAAPPTMTPAMGKAPPAMEKIPDTGTPAKDATPNKLPTGATGGAPTITPSSLRVNPMPTVTLNKETPDPFDLDRRYEARVDRAADYSWLTGQLFFVHTDGGLWVLRYAPLEREDANGGGVILARDLQLDRYRDGDLVKVHGSIIAEHGSSHLGAPLYRVTSIQLVERAQ